MGNILGPQRHAIHHGSARAPHPEHDSRDVYSESGRPPFLAQAVQQPGGVMPATLEEQILGEPDTRGPMATSRGTAEVRPEPVPIPIPARDAIAPVQPATQVEHPALARSENAETLNARALEAIGRFKEIEDLQHSSREYLGRLEQRIKDLRGRYKSHYVLAVV